MIENIDNNRYKHCRQHETAANIDSVFNEERGGGDAQLGRFEPAQKHGAKCDILRQVSRGRSDSENVKARLTAVTQRGDLPEHESATTRNKQEQPEHRCQYQHHQTDVRESGQLPRLVTRA